MYLALTLSWKQTIFSWRQHFEWDSFWNEIKMNMKWKRPINSSAHDQILMMNKGMVVVNVIVTITTVF